MKDEFEIFKANYTHLINHKHGCSFFSDMVGSDNCDCGIMKEMWAHIQKDLQDERKKTLEEVWGVINEKLDTLDINTQEQEVNVLVWLNKKIDVAITRLSKLLKEGNEKD